MKDVELFISTQLIVYQRRSKKKYLKTFLNSRNDLDHVHLLKILSGANEELNMKISSVK